MRCEVRLPPPAASSPRARRRSALSSHGHKWKGSNPGDADGGKQHRSAAKSPGMLPPAQPHCIPHLGKKKKPKKHQSALTALL